jgi:hypothetical protein
MTNEKNSFLGTYFDRDSVLRLARWLNIASWIAVAVYGGQFLLSFTVYILQMTRGMAYILGPTDLVQQVLWFVEPNFKGVVYFLLLQALARLLLILLDIEDNTRAARK